MDLCYTRQVGRHMYTKIMLNTNTKTYCHRTSCNTLLLSFTPTSKAALNALWIYPMAGCWHSVSPSTTNTPHLNPQKPAHITWNLHTSHGIFFPLQNTASLSVVTRRERKFSPHSFRGTGWHFAFLISLTNAGVNMELQGCGTSQEQPSFVGPITYLHPIHQLQKTSHKCVKWLLSLCSNLAYFFLLLQCNCICPKATTKPFNSICEITGLP